MAANSAAEGKQVVCGRVSHRHSSVSRHQQPNNRLNPKNRGLRVKRARWCQLWPGVGRVNRANGAYQPFCGASRTFCVCLWCVYSSSMWVAR